MLGLRAELRAPGHPAPAVKIMNNTLQNTGSPKTEDTQKGTWRCQGQQVATVRTLGLSDEVHQGQPEAWAGRRGSKRKKITAGTLGRPVTDVYVDIDCYPAFAGVPAALTPRLSILSAPLPLKPPPLRAQRGTVLLNSQASFKELLFINMEFSVVFLI